MDTEILQAAVCLAGCQVSTEILCSRLYTPRFSPPLQWAACLAAAAAAGWLSFIWAEARFAALCCALAWNVLSAGLLYHFRAVFTAAFGWNLCMLSALAMQALGEIAGHAAPPLSRLIMAVSWFFANGILLGIAVTIVRATRGEETNWARFLLNTSCNLEFAVVGIFICRVITTETPYTDEAVGVVLLLSVSFLFLLYMHKNMLQDDLRWQRRRELIQAELQEQEKEFAEWTAVLASARRMRHDYNNHAVVARSLADAGETQAALAYLQKVRAAWEQETPRVELQAFGQISGVLAQACAACGIVLQIGGDVPHDAGIRYQKAQRLLTSVTEWAIRQLRGTKNAVIELQLCGRDALLCRLTPAAMPGAEAQEELRACCPSCAVEFGTEGSALQLCISDAFRAAPTDRPQKWYAP